MPARKRASHDADAAIEPVAKRRSSRQAAAAAAASVAEPSKKKTSSDTAQSTPATAASKKRAANGGGQKSEAEGDQKPKASLSKKTAGEEKKQVAKASRRTKTKKDASGASDASDDAKTITKKSKAAPATSRAASEDPDVDSIPIVNSEAPRHDGEWYWLMKAEPESRFENGIDVRFSIDDLRAREKPEGWDGIRAYAARNHMRNMNAGDKAFFYHSNCKEPGIAGTMEIVKEFSEDKSARRPGTPYYDPQSTKEKPRWSLVHVEFSKKFAVPISLKELRDFGKPGGPLENMQMLKQTRLSVSRVSSDEWEALCEIADKKARDAGLEHETTKLSK